MNENESNNKNNKCNGNMSNMFVCGRARSNALSLFISFSQVVLYMI